MPIEFRCPNCERLLRTGEDKAGATAKCPQCGTAVLVPEARSTDPAAMPADFVERGAVDAGQNLITREVVCPMCGNANDASAPRCLACGEDLGTGPDGLGFADESSRSFASIWREAWTKWSANLGICCASAVIAGGMLFGVYILFIVFIMLAGFGFAVAGGGGGGGNVGIIVVLVMVSSVYLLMFVLYSYLLVGLANLSLRICRYRDVSLAAMFTGVGTCLASLVDTLLIMIALTLAAVPGGALYVYGMVLTEELDTEGFGIALAICGYFLMFAGWGLGWMFFWPVHYALADGAGILAALGRGVRIALANPLLSFLLALTHTGLMLAGGLICYVGLLFTMPLSFTLFAVAYNRCSRSEFRRQTAEDGDQQSDEPSSPDRRVDLPPPTADF